ncbi:hypothetical protein [Megasphaera vaginalis (ex Srinivasan et al. 2021)]|uniref:Uncharacterized protein n=1 Tax=Megasphaera vaginalis (ex Srinivasan et al. 2021) TaxID=1111454 RepID=U7UPD7_9FIRM|nr:hypothetical protein [Megasphaera vaginalis (ex Srinivasan et al. 2021)]ERT60764.1 hypothetical protein HMPREF1250_0277 [Megasphaera vaginalis (ex Srinivasan et al. 2021)]
MMRWIETIDELPDAAEALREKYQPIIFIDAWGGLYIGYFDGKNFISTANDGDWIDKVVAWAPIPPYRGFRYGQKA